MNTSNVFTVLVSFLLFLVHGELVSAQQKLKIMSYNIHHGADTADRDRLDEMAAFITESGADIVGLQEVDSVCQRSGGVDQAFHLAQKTGMYYSYTRHFAYDGGSYGLALLSKFPIKMTVNERLPVSSGGTTSFLIAEVAVSAKETISIGVVHLDYRNDSARVRQAELVGKIIEGTKYPFILTGDMNAEPSHEPLAILSRQLIFTQDRDAFTFPVPVPKKKIDYIMVDKNLKASVMAAKVLPVLLSDHLPIVSEIALYD